MQYYPSIKQNYYKNEMTVNGEGRIMVQPDIAIITVGIQTESKELQEAQMQNAISTKKVIEALYQIGIRQQDIQTVDYNIRQEYDYVDGKQIFRAYVVVTNLSITIRDISQVGRAYQVAVENGANLTGPIQFTVSNPYTYYRKALQMAVLNAENKAKTIAQPLDLLVKKTPIKIIEERIPGPVVPLYSQKTYETAALEPPISAGQIEIRAAVTVIFVYR